MKTTKWFKGVEPVRKGVYQRRYSWGINYAYFDGVDWGLACDTAEEAQRWEHSVLRVDSDLPWRGLATEGGGT